MDNLMLKARELEEKAKKEKEDFNKKSKLYLEAANTYKRAGDERKWKLNLARYYSTEGNTYSRSGEFDRARTLLKNAEKLFLELGRRKGAFYCAYDYVRTYIFEEKSKEVPTNEFFETVESVLRKYKNFSGDKRYREIEALKLEKKAEKAKNEENYEVAAELHLKAAEIYKQIGYERHWKWNLANYHLIKGKIYFYSNKFDEARKSLKTAEEQFLELGLREPAFFCVYNYIRTYDFEEKLKQDLSVQKYLEKVKLFLEEYKDFSKHKIYIEVKISLYKKRSKEYRLEGKFENAEFWAKKCYELAKQAYNKFRDEDFRKAALFNEQMYWNLKAKRFESEEKFKEAAECYKKSAEVISEIDKNLAYDEYVNCYKCLAIANKYDKDIFEENANKAIEFAEKRKDEKQKFYLLGFKYDQLVKFAHSIEERIRLLKQAKENYYRAGEKSLGRAMEFVLFYYLSQKELMDGNYTRAIDFLNKAKKYSRDAKFPNIISSPTILDTEEYLYRAYLHFSHGDFSNATYALGRYLDKGKDLENTGKYKFFEMIRNCSELLSKESFSEKDLYTAEELLQLVRERRLSLDLYKICSLVYSYISLWIHNIRDKEILEKIKLNIIRRITTEEVAKDLERRIEIHRAVERRDWLLKLPPVFAERFDHCLYFLENVLEEFRHTAIREFYTLLENFLKIIVEFNAKILWQGNWKLKLVEKISNNQKPFEKFTFGDFVQSLKLLNNNGVEYCKDVPEDILSLLDKHVEIRNNLTHEFVEEPPDIDIVEDTSKIMYVLLRSFPTCIKIINTKKRPWYDVEILWNWPQKRASLYCDDKELERYKYYYIKPNIEIVDNNIHSKVIVPISTGTMKNVLRL